MPFRQSIEMFLFVHQLLESSIFNNFTFPHYHNLIGILNRCQSMGNRNAGLVFQNWFQVLEYDFLSVHVQSTRRFVENIHARFPDQRPCQSDSLFLTT